ncbi:hypothetical protein D3C71_1553710 [compost metagenome]
MLLRGVTQFGRGARGYQGRGGKMADGIAGQIAVSDHGIRLGSGPGLDNTLAQLTGSRVVTQDARIDVQKFHMGSPSEDRHRAIKLRQSYR